MPVYHSVKRSRSDTGLLLENVPGAADGVDQTLFTAQLQHLAQIADVHLEDIHSRELDVEHDEVWVALECKGQGVGTVIGDVGYVALIGEGSAEQVGDLLIVIDDEDPLLHGG